MNRNKYTFITILTTGTLLAAGLLSSCKPQAEPGESLVESSPATEAAVAAPAAPENFSVYIAMPDGVLLATDIYLPDEASRPDRIPAIVEFTRYWRATDMEPSSTDLPEEISQSLDAGFAKAWTLVLPTSLWMCVAQGLPRVCARLNFRWPKRVICRR